MPFGFGKGTKSAAVQPDARGTAREERSSRGIGEENQTPSATADLMGELAREEGRRRADSDRSSGSSIPSKGSPQGSPKGSPRSANDDSSPVREVPEAKPKLTAMERIERLRAARAKEKAGRQQKEAAHARAEAAHARAEAAHARAQAAHEEGDQLMTQALRLQFDKGKQQLESLQDMTDKNIKEVNRLLAGRGGRGR